MSGIQAECQVFWKTKTPVKFHTTCAIQRNSLDPCMVTSLLHQQRLSLCFRGCKAALNVKEQQRPMLSMRREGACIWRSGYSSGPLRRLVSELHKRLGVLHM